MFRIPGSACRRVDAPELAVSMKRQGILDLERVLLDVRLPDLGGLEAERPSKSVKLADLRKRIRRRVG